MKIVKIVILFFLALGTSSFSQDQKSFGKFSNKEAKKILSSARKNYNYRNYTTATEKYTELLKMDSANPVYNYEQALTLYNNYLQPKSIPFFERAIRDSKDTIGEAYFYLANSYHLSNKFDEAQKNYKTYLYLLEKFGTDLLPEEEKELKDDIKHRIAMCDNGKKLIQTPVDKLTLNGKTHTFQILNTGKGVNSNYDDYGAVLSANDSVMYFTTRREGTTGGKIDWDDKYFEDIYVSKLGKNGWGESVSIGAPINTEKHEAMIGIAPDGKTLYFYKGIKQGTFYYSNLVNGSWTKPAMLYEKSDINSKAWETSFFGFTISGTELYVVSDRDGGLGGRDIYVAKKQTDGSWGALTDIGEPINTKYDEDAPFITPDGKNMYFSSQGHNSMGGFDVFKSERKPDGSWSEPVNLGVPINTTGNDIYFTIANKSDRAYYSSSLQAADSTTDMDIYMIDLCDDVPTTTISGLALGISTGTILITEKESGKQVGNFEIKDGRYSILVNHGKNYVFTLNTSGIEPASLDVYVPKQCKRYELYQELAFIQPGQPLIVRDAFFDIKNEAGTSTYSDYLAKADKSKLQNYNEISVNTNAIMTVKVDTIKTTAAATTTTTAATATSSTTASANNTNTTAEKSFTTTTTSATTTTAIKTTISFNNVLFAFGKSRISKEYLPELDKAVALLKGDYAQVKFEIAGYTDSKGKASYNKTLSKLRANAVAKYFASKGISRSRMKIVGYGKDNPVAPNTNADGTDNKEGRAKNRRTEIVIIQ